jgi:alpha-galactosidase
LSLVKNADLIDMARLGRASTPVDLMTYAPSDLQPSVFLLQGKCAAVDSDDIQLDR